MVYFLLAFLALAFYFYENAKSPLTINIGNYAYKNINKHLFSLIILILTCFFLSAFKSNSIGIDTQSYLMVYNYNIDYFIPYLQRIFYPESLFHIYILVCKIIGFSFHQFIFISYLIIYLCIGYFLYHNSKNVGLSILVFISFGYFTLFLSALRQSFAISFGLIMFNELFKNNKRNAIILFIIALGFHKSAIILLFAFLLNKINIEDKKIIKLTVIVLLTCFFIPKQLIYFFANILGYDTYFEFNEGGSNYYLVLLHIIMSLMILIINVYYNKSSNKLINKYITFLLFGTLIYTISLKSVMISRFAYYFQILIIVCYQSLLIRMKIDKYKIVKIIMILCLFVYLFFTIKNDILHTLYYKSYLLEQKGDSTIYEEY